MTFEIDISCRSKTEQIDLSAIRAAIDYGLQCEGVQSAILSISVVDNAEIHRLNKQHLDHDYSTDVISFQLDWTGPNGTSQPALTESGRSTGATLEGEIVVSAEYATETAPQCGWSAIDELTLYVIHGMLHICGYDDLTPDEKLLMRAREREILRGLGLTPQYPDDVQADDDEPPGRPSGSTLQVSQEDGR